MGGGAVGGVGLPVLYLQDGMNRTKISRVRPNLSFRSHGLSFFSLGVYIINNFIKDKQTSASPVSTHSILCTALYMIYVDSPAL